MRCKNNSREYVLERSVKKNGTTYYYITNRIGNVRYVLDSSSSAIRSYLYSSFGQIRKTGRFTSVDRLIREVEKRKKEEGMGYERCLGCGGYMEVRVGAMEIEKEELVPEIETPERKYQQPYVYVENNPMNEIDPEGLFDVPPPQPPAGPKRECWNFLFKSDSPECDVANCYGCCEVLFPPEELIGFRKKCYEKCLSDLPFLKCVYKCYYQKCRKYKDSEKKEQKKKKKCKKKCAIQCRKRYPSQ